MRGVIIFLQHYVYLKFIIGSMGLEKALPTTIGHVTQHVT